MTAVFAHRGVVGEHPENTLGSFLEARRLGADGVELDVRRTADGALVVHHDPVIPGVGPVADTPARLLPAHIPLLGDVLEACDGLVVNVEIKNAPGEPGHDPTEAAAVALAKAVGAGRVEQVLVSSFTATSLDAVRRTDSRVAVGWLLGVGADPRRALPRALSRGYGAIHPFVAGVGAPLMEEAHGAGLAVNVWTVNAEADLRAMTALGADTVITDRLALALAITREGNREAGGEGTREGGGEGTREGGAAR